MTSHTCKETYRDSQGSHRTPPPIFTALRQGKRTVHSQNVLKPVQEDSLLQKPLPPLVTNSPLLQRLLCSQDRGIRCDSPVPTLPSLTDSHPCTPSSRATPSLESPQTPSNPICQWQSTATKSSAKPFEDIPIVTSYLGNSSERHRAEIPRLWTEAIHKAQLNENKTAATLFKELMNSSDMPDYLLDYAAVNIGLVMLRENAGFATLHIFFTVLQDLRPGRLVSALCYFAMGLAAWDMAVNCKLSSGAEAPFKYCQNAKLFFRLTLMFFGLKTGIDFKPMGMSYVLELRAVMANIDACYRGLAACKEMKDTQCLLTIPLAKIPDHALFSPFNVRIRAEIGRSTRDENTAASSKIRSLEVVRNRRSKYVLSGTNSVSETETWIENQLKLREAELGRGSFRMLMATNHMVGQLHQKRPKKWSGQPNRQGKSSLMKDLPPLPSVLYQQGIN